jgi:hypothetical protein
MELPPEMAEAIFRTRHPQWSTCTAAILKDNNGTLSQHGTATLFRMGGRFFAVTASHVVVPEKANSRLRLWLVNCHGDAVLLRGEAVVSHRPGGRDDDPADVAVVVLTTGEVEALEGCSFLCQVDIAPGDNLADDYYFWSGFPQEWAALSGPKPNLELLTYCTQPYRGRTSGFRNFNPDWHLLLRCGGALELSGERAKMPRWLEGISGCSIWRSYYVNGGESGSSRVVAVQTGKHLNGTVVKATRWSFVVKMLFANYPDLRPAMDLRLSGRGL